MNLHTLRKTGRGMLSHYSWTAIVLVVFALLLCTSQIERYIHRGTVLGYQLAHKAAVTSLPKVAPRTVGPTARNKNQPTAVGTPSANQKSLVCSKLPADKVGGILKLKIDQAQSFIPDHPAPNVLSYCNYRSVVDTKIKPSVRTVSLLYRSYTATTEANRIYNISVSRGQEVDVKKFADNAYFIASLNQLTVQKGNQVVVITVSPPAAGAITSKDAALVIAQAGLFK